MLFYLCKKPFNNIENENLNLKYNIFKDEVVVIIGHGQLYVLEDELVHHDVVPNHGIDEFFVVNYFLRLSIWRDYKS